MSTFTPCCLLRIFNALRRIAIFCINKDLYISTTHIYRVPTLNLFFSAPKETGNESIENRTFVPCSCYCSRACFCTVFALVFTSPATLVPFPTRTFAPLLCGLVLAPRSGGPHQQVTNQIDPGWYWAGDYKNQKPPGFPVFFQGTKDNIAEPLNEWYRLL
jgi:hypothetical protein